MPNTDFVRDLGVTALGTRLKRLFDRLNEPVTALYRQQLGFEQRWFALTLFLEHHGPSTIGAAAKALGQSHAAVVQVVNAMLAAGLVARQKNPKDKRSSVITLTADGQDIAAQVRMLSQDVDRAAHALLKEAAPDLVDALDQLDLALSRRSFHLRLADALSPSIDQDITHE
ncbi:MAG: MarR family transcriptional regulator [Pseudomonadota bacterium]